MNSFILKKSSIFIAQIMIVLSFILVLRGHDYPGGGFIGGLTAVSSIGLLAIAFDFKHSAKRLRKVKLMLASAMLLLGLSLVMGVAYGKLMLEGVWTAIKFNGIYLKVGTPLMFDFAIYLTVCAGFSWVILLLESER